MPESSEQPFKIGGGINEDGEKTQEDEGLTAVYHIKLLVWTRKVEMGKLNQFNSNLQL